MASPRIVGEVGGSGRMGGRGQVGSTLEVALLWEGECELGKDVLALLHLRALPKE
jgi:hypothetical protein